MNTTDLKRAVIYIRVSTKQQAVRDGNPEGYSLPTQREACTRKAESLGAIVVEEYVDKDTGTAVDERPAMQRLLARIERDRDLDYVIIHKLDRWARSQREDLVGDFVLELANCALVSCSEPIDRTAAGRLLHGMLASVNEYHSRNMSDEIKRKIILKVQEGGTHGPARLGYKNVGEGGKRWITIDPEPAELIRWCFMTYATGEWSVSKILDEATQRGLLSRGGPNTPRKPLTLSQMHRILTNPYYKGIVVFNGVSYQGKHEPIIDEQTWQRVQDNMASRANGEKQREHRHYLRGTIFCGHCGSRLVVSYSRGKLGKVYPYYFCVGKQQKRTTCQLKYRPIAVIEEEIEEHYRWLQLTSEGLERTASAVLAELAKAQRETAHQLDHYRNRLKSLEAERQKLLQAHYADAIPLALLKTEQDRISDEVSFIESQLEGTTASSARLKTTANRAVARARNCHAAYLEAGPRERRIMNRAFFEAIWVTEEGVVGWEYNEPFATLLRAHRASEPRLLIRYTPTKQSQADDAFEAENGSGTCYRRSPGRWAGAYFSKGSKTNDLAERVGFEPTVGFPTHDFQSCRFGRSRTPPGMRTSYAILSHQEAWRRARWSGPAQRSTVNRVRA
jgi:site-specific DNA recombinase